MPTRWLGVAWALVGCSSERAPTGGDVSDAPTVAVDVASTDAHVAPDQPADSAVAFDTRAGVDAPPARSISVTTIDESNTGYATFQSHNQKVVDNGHGIFVTYLHSYGGDTDLDTKATFRLARSVDDGKTFATVYEATFGTKAPVIETDVTDAIYLVHPDWATGDARFYRFEAKDGYAKPAVTTVIPGGSSGKYAMTRDPTRNVLFYLTWSTLYTLSTDGVVLAAQPFFTAGPNAGPQYPLLDVAADGTLFAAWTTVAVTDTHYYDVHFLTSWDGGRSWGLPFPGKMVTLPVVCDDTGPATEIATAGEIGPKRSNWLASFAYDAGKLHFFYNGMQLDAFASHYARFDWNPADPKVDRRIDPVIRGSAIEIEALDGFFVHSDPGGAFRLVSHTLDGRIAVLSSTDAGATFHDDVLSAWKADPKRAIYAVGGQRRVAADGAILGTFGEVPLVADGTPTLVRFFRVK